MQTISRKEFEAKYGSPDLYGFGKKEKEESTFANIKNQIKGAALGGIDKSITGAKDIYAQTQKPLTEQNPLKTIKGATAIPAGAVETAFSPLAPIFEPISKGINYVADKVSNNKAVQKFAGTKAGQATADVAETAQNVSTVAGAAVGPKTAKVGATKTLSGARDTVASGMTKTGEKLGGVTSDIKGAAAEFIPQKDTVINTVVRDAMGFTTQDVGKLAKNTGNELGVWMGQNDLIGTNKANTLGLVNKFFTDNYTKVRAEIDKVTDTYTPEQIPRVREGLTFLKEEIGDTLGLEKVKTEIDTLLQKEEYTLADIQRVKELIDENTNIYKDSGDVRAARQAEGLDNVRGEIKDFIEAQVMEKTGADIREMNNNVQTAQGIRKINETRGVNVSKKFFSFRDILIGLGLFAGAGPLVGVAAVFALKLSESPSALLRFGRFLDDLPKAKKKEINDALLRGEVPKEALEASGVQIPKKSFNEGEIPATKGADSLLLEAKKYKTADEFVKAQTKRPDYGYGHSPNEDGVRAFNLTEKVDGEQMIPSDMYERWYGSRGTAEDLQSISVLKKIKGNPEADVVVYRASPKEGFNYGDWITLSEKYAKQHAEGNNFKVFSQKVKAKDIRWAMDDINEFGYFPESTKSQLTDIWNKANKQ